MLNLADSFNRITTVALYDTLGKEAMRFIIDQTELTTVALSNDLITKFCQLKLDDANMDEQRLGRVTALVAFDDAVTDADKEMATKAGLTIHTFNGVMAKGREAAVASTPFPDVKPDDVFMLSYTSGTTGDPKGVMMTNKSAIIATYAANLRLGANSEVLSEKDTHISYLPLAHVFEQLLQCIVVQYGMRSGFFSGNVLKLTEDIGIL
jgi:long-chain acyl-CoA synthetase